METQDCIVILKKIQSRVSTSSTQQLIDYIAGQIDVLETMSKSDDVKPSHPVFPQRKFHGADTP